MNRFGPLVSTHWLADRLTAPNVKIIDGSWRMPGEGDARADYAQKHIPGAVFFDIDAIADTSIDLPHMTPPPDVFEKAVGAMGISESDIVVVYDDRGIFSSARVWWTFRTMGHERVAVLDGGLAKWLTEDRPATAAPSVRSVVRYQASPLANWRRSAREVQAALTRGDAVVVDARPEARFTGDAPEPRAGLRAGHMPGAANVPFAALISQGGVLKDPREIADIFSAAGVDQSKEVITSCGSGVTAAILSLALEQGGWRGHALYDGSWAEWGDERNDDAEFPVEIGTR